MSRVLITLILLSTLLPVLTFAQIGKQAEYSIVENDLLEIRVYEEPDLTKIVRVAPDGTISYPLLGNIKVAGLTVRKLEETITDLLEKDYLISPQVSVFVQEYAKVSILGQVRNPGSYQMKGGLTLTQTIAMAGGFADNANINKVKILRNFGDKNKTIEIDVEQILDKLTSDIEIKGNDTIIVEAYGTVLVMGQVNKPGVYNFKKGLTIIEVIALAGGLTEAAAANGTKVIRIEGGRKKIIPVPVGSILKGGHASRDIALEPNDTIVIPESFF